MFTFFPLYLFFLEKIYVFIKISHCSGSENHSLAHIRKPSRWLWSLATFLIIWNASPEPAVNPLGPEETAFAGAVRRRRVRWSGTALILNVAIHHLGHCPELGSRSAWPLMGQPLARPSAFVPAEPLGTGAAGATPPPGLLLPAAACLLKTHLEIMTEE